MLSIIPSCHLYDTALDPFFSWLCTSCTPRSTLWHFRMTAQVVPHDSNSARMRHFIPFNCVCHKTPCSDAYRSLHCLLIQWVQWVENITFDGTIVSHYSRSMAEWAPATQRRLVPNATHPKYGPDFTPPFKREVCPTVDEGHGMSRSKLFDPIEQTNAIILHSTPSRILKGKEQAK